MFLTKLNSFLFEPILFTTLLGMVSFIVYKDKCNTGKWGWPVLALTLGMVAWRIFLAQGSSRYWSILIFPACVFTCYFCYLNFWKIPISRFILGIIILMCLGKDFHFNWNNRAIINVANVL